MKLKTKFSLAIATLVTLAVMGTGAMTIISERQLLIKELDQHHHQLIERLAKVSENSLKQNNLIFFNYIRTLKNERGFKGACFVDLNNIIRIHSNPELLDTQLNPSLASNTLNFSAPVYFAEKQVGTAHLFIDRTAIQHFLNQSLKANLVRIGFISLVVILISIVAAFVLASTLVSPINRIVRGMRKVSDGQLDPIDFPLRRDELGWLGDEINVTIGKLKELDEMKKDFTAGITHDLKSPLNAIKGIMTVFFNNLGKLSLDEQRDYLLSVQNNANRLLGLIDQLLLTAKIESMNDVTNCAEFDIRKSIQETETLFKPIAEQKKLSLLSYLPKKPLYVWADREHLVHILNNLVANALHYTANGGAEITTQENGKFVSIHVKDTGPGIPKQDQVRLFEKFYRSKEISKNTKGTGLGLFIVKNLVERQGGLVKIESNPGRGTDISFTLPKTES